MVVSSSGVIVVKSELELSKDAIQIPQQLGEQLDNGLGSLAFISTAKINQDKVQKRPNMCHIF